MTQPTNTTLPPYWQPYAAAVAEHIREYTIGQYSDWPMDKCTAYTVEDCLKQIDKYHLRQGKNVRPGEDARDLLKIGHYCAMTYTKTAGAILETPPSGTVREAEWQAFCAVVAEYMETGPFWAVPKIPTKDITSRIRRVLDEDPRFLNLDLFPELALRTAKEWVTLKPATCNLKSAFIADMADFQDLEQRAKTAQDALEAIGFSINAPIMDILDRVFCLALDHIAEKYQINDQALHWFVFENHYGADKGRCKYMDGDTEIPIIDAATFWDFEKSGGNKCPQK
jgi:hypothetical protein